MQRVRRGKLPGEMVLKYGENSKRRRGVGEAGDGRQKRHKREVKREKKRTVELREIGSRVQIEL